MKDPLKGCKDKKVELQDRKNQVEQGGIGPAHGHGGEGLGGVLDQEGRGIAQGNTPSCFCRDALLCSFKEIELGAQVPTAAM